jgi:queuine tRNA-ribosyltransferase
MGVDIAMMLDECTTWPVEERQAEASWERTLAWARRARAAWREGDTALFGIVQGSVFPDLRRRAARELAELDFAGYAIGGVSVGEPEGPRHEVVEWTAPELPEHKPRYLMGVGYPEDILHAVSQGVDLFDCVLPARNARHGVLFTREGVIKSKNARYREDERPLDPGCGCPACSRTSRAFLHHLTRSGELTAAVLGTLHNVRYYLDFMADLRQAIQLGTLTERASLACRTTGGASPDGPGLRVPPASSDPLEQRSS